MSTTIYGNEVRTQDGDGNNIKSYNESLSVHNVYANNAMVSRYAHQHTGITTTLTADTSTIGATYIISVSEATGFAVGDFIHINTTSVELTHPKILAISSATGASDFTLDRRLDSPHLIGDSLEKAVVDLASQIGTQALPQEYLMEPVGNEVINVTKAIITMSHPTAGDMGLFGGIDPLPNGVILRYRINGVYTTIANWKTNGDIKGTAYNVDFNTRASGGGTFGTTAELIFTDSGSNIRLDGSTDDRIEVYIQDDPTLLTLMNVTFQGYFE